MPYASITAVSDQIMISMIATHVSPISVITMLFTAKLLNKTTHTTKKPKILHNNQIMQVYSKRM